MTVVQRWSMDGGRVLMKRHRIGRFAWSLFVLSAAFLAAASALLFLNRTLGYRALSPHLFVVPGFAIVGAVVATRHPRHPIGWLFLAMALVAATAALTLEYALRAVLTAPRPLPGGVLAAWVAQWIWLLNLPALAVLLLLFPNGRLPTPRWRPVVWMLGLSFGAVTIWTMFRPDPVELDVLQVANPMGIAALEPLSAARFSEALAVSVVVVIMLALVASTLAPFVRRRQAHAEERQQLKWLAFAAAGSSVTGAAGVLLAWNAAIAESWRSTVQAVAVALLIVAFLGVVVGIPVTVGLAISKYRLYDIDRIINRVLVYGLLTAVLGLCYTAGSLMFVLVAGAGSNAPSWLVAGATLAAAAIFRPVRRRIQAAVDRHFNRRRYDAVRTVEAFSGRLRDEIALDPLSAELVRVMDHALQPTQASLWLRPRAHRPH